MTSLPATFAIEALPDGSGFRLAGELDLATAPRLGAALTDAQPADRLVLDFGEVTFVDSSGCGVLLSCVRSELRPSRLTIVNAGESVMRSFVLMGLDGHPQIDFE
jgi:anti-sigma B factor antagonist